MLYLTLANRGLHLIKLILNKLRLLHQLLELALLLIHLLVERLNLSPELTVCLLLSSLYILYHVQFPFTLFLQGINFVL